MVLGNQEHSWENCAKWPDTCPHRKEEAMSSILAFQQAGGDTMDISQLEASYEFCSNCSDYQPKG